MLKLVVLFSIMISSCLSMTLRSEPIHISKQLKTSEILGQDGKDANGYRTFNVMGKLYKAKLQSQHMNLPVMMMLNENKKMEKMKSSGTHEMYLDELNDASFTVSTHFDEDGKKSEIVRANILASDHELVLEPVMAQKSAANDEDDPPPVSRKPMARLNTQDKELVLEPVMIQESLANNDDPSPAPPPEPMTKLYTRSLDYIDDYHKSKRAFKSESFENLNMLSRSEAQEGASRSRRQSGPVNNFVEMLSVFDYPFYLFATQATGSTTDSKIASFLQGYACQVINVANLCYQRSFSNVTSLKITLRPKLFIILKNAAVSDFSTKSANLLTINGATKGANGRSYLSGDKAVYDANAWLIRQINGGNLASNSFDSASFFTGHDLYSSSGSNLLGIAPMSGTCTNGTRGFLVEDGFGLDSGMTLAHELAHNLGVQHDIDNNPTGSASCQDSTNYIMSTSMKFTNMQNSFYFSPCSISKLVSIIVTNNQLKCLANSYTLPTDVTTFIQQFYPGQLYNLTEQCRMRFDSTYFP